MVVGGYSYWTIKACSQKKSILSYNTSMTHYPRPEVHSTCIYHNCSFLASIIADPGDPSLVPRPSYLQVYDRLKYTKVEGKGLENLNTICSTTMICCHTSSQQPSDVRTNLAFCAI